MRSIRLYGGDIMEAIKGFLMSIGLLFLIIVGWKLAELKVYGYIHQCVIDGVVAFLFAVSLLANIELIDKR